ncbi:MAG: hypothetical protein Q7R60_01910 [bacterium]|nr:hypothetical protein [bacterium]
MARNLNRDKPKLLAELLKMPVVQVACQRANVPRSTYYRWLEADSIFAEDVKQAINFSTGIVNDMAVSKAIEGIRDGIPIYVIYWLNNRHPDFNQSKASRNPSEVARLQEELRQELKKRRDLIKAFLEDAHDKAPEALPPKSKTDDNAKIEPDTKT